MNSGSDIANGRRTGGHRILAVACTAGLSLAAAGVRAHDGPGKHFDLRGFGTVAVTTHDADGVEYRRNVGQARGIAADDFGFESDSLAGLQLNAHLAPSLDGVVQAVTRQTAQGDWKPRVTQSFLRYSPDESWVIRAGRFGYDIYLLAESRQVGYSYLAVRPSPDFYGLVTNDEVDGLDVAWTARLERGLVRTRLFAGRGSDATALDNGSQWEGRSDAVGLSIDYAYRAFTARAALVEVSYGRNPEFIGLGRALVETGAPDAVDIGSELVASSQRSRGMQIGVAYDGGPLQAQVLHGHILSDSIAGPNVRAWLTQVGYRVGTLTPFVAFTKSRDRDAMRTTGLPDLPEFAPLNVPVWQLQHHMRATQESASVGVRWDFAPRWDLKFQADFTSIVDSALNFDRRPAARGDVDMTVLTAGVDFVF